MLPQKNTHRGTEFDFLQKFYMETYSLKRLHRTNLFFDVTFYHKIT